MKTYFNELKKVDATEGVTPILVANTVAQKANQDGYKSALDSVEYHIKQMSKKLQFNLETERGKYIPKKDILKLIKDLK